jgi:hypothetical protein
MRPDDRAALFSGGFGTFKLLADHALNQSDGGYLVAGTVFAPTHAWASWFADPLDATGTAALYGLGPPPPNLNTLVWNGQQLKGVTYWIQVGPTSWALSGLGANRTTYPPISTGG